MRIVKPLFILVLVCFCLSACDSSVPQESVSPDASAVEESPAVSVDPGVLTLSPPQGSVDGIYSGKTNANGVPDGYGIFEAAGSDPFRFYGLWRKGALDGPGIVEYKDGAYIAGKMHGWVPSGICVYYQGDVAAVGKWNGNSIVEYVTIYDQDGTFFGYMADDGTASGMYFYPDQSFKLATYDGSHIVINDNSNDNYADPPAEPAPAETVAPDPADFIARDLRGRIIAEYSMTDIDDITINDDLGTDQEGDYVALVYLTWTQKNNGELSEAMLTMYSDDLAAWAAENCESVQEIAIFWTVPYLDANAKRSYERRGDGMYLTDSVFGSAFE